MSAGIVRITGAGPSRPAGEIGLSDNARAGSALAIHLTEQSSVNDPAGSQAPNFSQWRLEVYVSYGEGEYLLGSFRTQPVAVSPAAARTVALCYCPGAKTWRVVAFGPQGATCRVTLSSDECCGNGGFSGIVPVNGSQEETPVTPSPVFGAGQGIFSLAPGVLFRMHGSADIAIGAPVFVGPVDTSAAVINGNRFRDAPYQIPSGTPLEKNFLLEWPKGLDFANGIRWAASSTADPITLGPTLVSVGGTRA